MSVPSAAELGKNFSAFLDHGIKAEYAADSKEVTASLNLDALKSFAEQRLGKLCTGLHLVDEGGFNQVFILTFEQFPDVVARVNGSMFKQDLTQPSELLDYRLLSEVDTLAYVYSSTSIPVPKVYAVVSEEDNPVRARYTLQQRICGQSLGRIMDDLDDSQVDAVLKQIFTIEGKLFQTEFNSIGSLRAQGPQVIVGHAGLSCLSPYPFRGDIGPWQSSASFIIAYIHAECALLEDDLDEWAQERKQFADWRGIDLDRGTQVVAYFKSWYRLFSEGLRLLDLSAYDPPHSPFVLYHEDLCPLNVMVAYDDPTEVVGIVDWEGSRVVPLWYCAMFDRLLEESRFPDEQRRSYLREIRDKTHQMMQPAIKHRDRLNLPYLFHLASSRLSVQLTPHALNDKFLDWLEYSCPDEDAIAFEALKAYILTNNHKRGSQI